MQVSGSQFPFRFFFSLRWSEFCWILEIGCVLGMRTLCFVFAVFGFFFFSLQTARSVFHQHEFRSSLKRSAGGRSPFAAACLFVCFVLLSCFQGSARAMQELLRVVASS